MRPVPLGSFEAEAIAREGKAEPVSSECCFVGLIDFVATIQNVIPDFIIGLTLGC